MKQPFQSILRLTSNRSIIETLNQAYTSNLTKESLTKFSFRSQKNQVSCVVFALNDVLHVDSLIIVNRRPIFDETRNLILPDRSFNMKKQLLICFFGTASRDVKPLMLRKILKHCLNQEYSTQENSSNQDRQFSVLTRKDYQLISDTISRVKKALKVHYFIAVIFQPSFTSILKM